jgi:hypothetical protein
MAPECSGSAVVAVSDDGVICYARCLPDESLVAVGGVQLQFSHISAPERIETLATSHQAPISILKFAGNHIGMLLVSVDTASRACVWRCRGGCIIQWSPVENFPNLKHGSMGIALCASWVHSGTLPSTHLPTYVPALRAEASANDAELRAHLARTMSPLDAKFIAPPSSVTKVRSTHLSPGHAACCLATRSKLIVFHERAETKRWGFVLDLLTLAADIVSGDIHQSSDGCVRFVALRADRRSVLVYRVAITSHETPLLEATVDATWSYADRLVSRLCFDQSAAAHSVLVTTQPDQAALAALPLTPDDAASVDTRLQRSTRIEAWCASTRKVAVSADAPFGAASAVNTDTSEWLMRGAHLLLGDNMLTSANPAVDGAITAMVSSRNGVIALLTSDSPLVVHLRSASTLHLLAQLELSPPAANARAIAVSFSTHCTSLLVAWSWMSPSVDALDDVSASKRARMHSSLRCAGAVTSVSLARVIMAVRHAVIVDVVRRDNPDPFLLVRGTNCVCVCVCVHRSAAVVGEHGIARPDATATAHSSADTAR